MGIYPPLFGLIGYFKLGISTFVLAGLENSTCPLVFTSASGCRASENFDISCEN